MVTPSTAAELIDAFGGNTCFAVIYSDGPPPVGPISPNSVAGWRKNGKFPARTFNRIESLAVPRGLTVPRDLFTFDPPIKESES